MGVLNITPDSFSDGSELARSDRSEFRFDRDKVLFKAAQMVRDGALILDVGGESTRPGASPVPVDEELIGQSLFWKYCVLNSMFCCLLTPVARVMSAALAAGAGLVMMSGTDSCRCQAGRAEAQAAPAVCLMHMQGQPASMQETFSYESVVDEVFSFLKHRIADTEQAGVERSGILVIRVLLR